MIHSSKEHDLDIWQISSSQSRIDIYSPSPSQPLPLSLISISHTSSNISASVPLQESPPSPGALPSKWNLTSLENSTYHSSYHPLWEVDAFIHELARLYPETASVFELGHSAEGREMWGLKISRQSSANESATPKLGFVITGAQHAREVRSFLSFCAALSNETIAFSG